MKLKNIVKMGVGISRGRLFKEKVPLNVMLSVTNQCQSRCSYCNIPNRDQSELSTKEILKLINEIVASGAQRLGLWGGEPLVREDIDQIINYAKDKGLYVTLDSNGYLVPEKIDKLKNLDHLILAFDGAEREHDLNREKGSYQRLMKAIEIAAKKLRVWTITVLTKDNLNSFDFVLETAKKYGFLTTFQLVHHNEKLGKDPKLFIPSQEMYRTAIRRLIVAESQGAPIASSSQYLKYLLDWPDYTRPVLSERRNALRCLAGQFYCSIDTDGSVYPCSLMVGRMKALNYLAVGFKNAFEAIRDIPCRACIASCYIEYNYLFSGNPGTIIKWIKSLS